MIPVPAFLTPRLIAGIAIASALVLSGWMARGKWDAGKIAKLELAHSQTVAAGEKKAREELEKARDREAALIETTKGIVDEARKTIVDLERSIGSADAASRGMLDAARRAASRCPSNPNPAPLGSSTGSNVPRSMSDGDRFLRVLGEVDGAAGAYATDSRRARIARATCEAEYNATMKAVNR